MKYFYFYQLILFLILTVFFPLLAAGVLFKKSFRRHIHQRLGSYSGAEKKELEKVRGGIWIHASSVGEVKMAAKIPVFKNRKALITTSTSSGKRLARKLFPSAAAVIMPLDFLFLWKRLIKICKPKSLFIAETELWPGLIFGSGDIPKALFNARMSDEKYRVYLRLGKFMKVLLRKFDVIFARDNKNRVRFIDAGARENSVELLGNLKYLASPVHPEAGDPRFKPVKHPVIVAGCTHEGEEEIIIRVVQRLRTLFPGIVLIISPRHLERIAAVEREFKKEGLSIRLWSDKKQELEPCDNIIIDRMGILSGIYSIADSVFVGGTFTSTGGHNVIEPAVWGKPVVVGPSYRNFTDEVEFFSSRGGLKVAPDEVNLYNILSGWFKDPLMRRRDGEKNFWAAEEKNKKAAASNLKLAEFIKKN